MDRRIDGRNDVSAVEPFAAYFQKFNSFLELTVVWLLTRLAQHRHVNSLAAFEAVKHEFMQHRVGLILFLSFAGVADLDL